MNDKLPARASGPHPSHVTRSSDASTYDEVCVNCGATDITGGGWGKLAEPCGKPDGAVREALLSAQAALSDGAFTGPLINDALKKVSAAIDRLDVKAEAKSQEPDAVAVKPLPSELLLYGLADAIGLSATIRRLGGGTIKHEFDRGGIKQLIDALRIRSALIHPTTKPEAPATKGD